MHITPQYKLGVPNKAVNECIFLCLPLSISTIGDIINHIFLTSGIMLPK